MKIVSSILILFVAGWACTTWYNVLISGNYYVTAPWFHSAFLTMLLIGALYLAYRAIRLISGKKSKSAFALVAFLLAAATIEGCTYAKNNQIVLYSEDCGVTWKQVPAGSRVPSGTGQVCFVKETMPGYEMQGDMDFYVLFKDQVKVRLRLTYSYLIEDPLAFMKVAKKLGRANADADEAQDDNDRFEGAENRVIETKIKKVTSDEFPKEDVVSHDINALELTYVDLVNAELKSRGVRITTFEMVPDFQPLTQQAIDAANADRIYAAKNMQEFGRQITLAKAGANQIVVQQIPVSKNSGKDQE